MSFEKITQTIKEKPYKNSLLIASQIEKTAKKILDARSKYSDCTMAQLYGENSYLFPELLKAHEENDKAVMNAYGFEYGIDESEIVARLFKMYEKLVKNK